MTGNRPADGGHLIIEGKDYAEFAQKEPKVTKYIKKFVGSQEFINREARYCLWLVGASPEELAKMPLVLKRIEACREDRLASPDAGRRKLADTPTLFREQLNPARFLIVPKVSSEQRRYVPIGFSDKGTIPSDLLFIVPDATLYHFGVLTSNVHMAWMRTVCGRLKSDYRYSRDVVYNNFPWSSSTDTQLKAIEQTAKAILDAREKYPDSSFASLYRETTMPPDLRKAHQANDRAVMAAYGFDTKISKAECVARLMEMYRELAK